MNVKLALPASDARGPVAAMLAGAGIATTGYEPGSRTLRSVLPDDGLTLRAFREKDIPVQVAMGNYDLGICGDLWLSEMQVRFPLQRIVRIGGLPGPAAEVYYSYWQDATRQVETANLDLALSPTILSSKPQQAKAKSRASWRSWLLKADMESISFGLVRRNMPPRTLD